MSRLRSFRLVFWVGIVLLLLMPFLPASIVLAEGVPCNDGEPDGVYSVATNGLQPKQDPNLCYVDNAQQSSSRSQAEQKDNKAGAEQFNEGDVSHPSAEPIGTGQTLYSQNADLACLDFDDSGLWRGTGQNRWYAGWGIQALNVDGQALFKENASFDLDESVGFGYALKVDHGKPFRSQIVSPEFEVPSGASVVAKVSYSIADPKPNHSVWAEISVHQSGDRNAEVSKGFYAGEKWLKLTSRPFVNNAREATKVQVTLQGNNLYNDTGIAIYFDNVEIWIGDKHATSCTYADEGLKFD